MKRLLVFLILFCFGCSSNKEEIESIELMAYRWEYKYPTLTEKGEFYIQPKLYSNIDLKGENESYMCEFSPNKKEVYFHSKIDEKIIEELVKESSLAQRKFEMPAGSYSTGGCFESTLTFRLNVRYADKKIKSYLLNYPDVAKIDFTIKKLYVSLFVNGTEEKVESIKDPVSLNRKKQAFINFSMRADTLILPLPPLPKYNKVKFKK
jgi:hypothetical protein